MRKTFRLNIGTPSTSMDLDFEAIAVVVNNPTASPVFIRTGSPDIPTETNADLFVPSGQSISYPTSGYTFAATFGQASSLVSSAAALSGLFQTCIVTFLGAGEAIPAYGSASFLTLSISEIIAPTSYAGPITSPSMDLGPWGGALISVFPGVASGQATLIVEVSNAGGTTANWSVLNTWALWPGVPVTVTIPHGLRYARIKFAATAIPGESTIGGSYAVRATLEEITSVSYSQSGLGISKPVTVANLGTTTNYFVTVGLPAISIRWQGATGNPLGEMVWYTGPSEVGPWALVAFREQVMGGASASLYRSVGNLDKFLRVDILDTDVIAGGLTGTLNLIATPESDTTSYLQNIYAALGDVGQSTPNVNQSIYHVLRTINTTNLAGFSTVDTDLLAINANIASILSQMATVLTNQTTMIADLSAMVASLASVAASQARSISPSGLTIALAAGVWSDVGAFVIPGNYITGVQASYGNNLFPGGATVTEIMLATGTASVAVSVFYRSFANAGGGIAWTGPSVDFASLRGGGFQVPSGHTHLWMQSTLLAGVGSVTISQVP